MSINVDCRCGAHIKLPEAMAGRSGRCGTCGEAVEVPLIFQAQSASPRRAQVRRKAGRSIAEEPSNPRGGTNGLEWNRTVVALMACLFAGGLGFSVGIPIIRDLNRTLPPAPPDPALRRKVSPAPKPAPAKPAPQPAAPVVEKPAPKVADAKPAPPPPEPMDWNPPKPATKAPPANGNRMIPPANQPLQPAAPGRPDQGWRGGNFGVHPTTWLASIDAGKRVPDNSPRAKEYGKKLMRVAESYEEKERALARMTIDALEADEKQVQPLSCSMILDASLAVLPARGAGKLPEKRSFKQFLDAYHSEAIREATPFLCVDT